jgi:hypothetical protein
MVAVNLKTSEFDVRIDRRSEFGNPFLIGRDGDRDEVCEKHRAWLWERIRTGHMTLEKLAQLHGKRLGCHCAPLRCHGDTLTAAAAWAHEELKKPAGERVLTPGRRVLNRLLK